MGQEKQETIKVCLDTNVLVSAIGWPGPEAAVVGLVLDGVVSLCITAEVLNEFYRVCQYPKFGFSEAEVDGFTGRLLINAELVEPVEKLYIITGDEPDNRFLECAVAGRVDYIISGDSHLLKLGFYKDIKIMRAPEFLKLFHGT
ncbi:MAG: putative toxin-antitoxin system toxin component, PIN family [Eubacteriales bacterium]|nr:putative toxin-antitoxin system toxin component, PIN family [Bacillota bacterium]